MADLKRRVARYGLSVEEYEALVREQNGACAICKKKPARWFCIDHCHATGVVRGLLCVKCNVGLGHFDEDPHLMRTATAYLEVFSPPRPPHETAKIFLRVEK
jgi:Recombination endonuclease VII